jgi:hypothetical protein
LLHEQFRYVTENTRYLESHVQLAVRSTAWKIIKSNETQSDGSQAMRQMRKNKAFIFKTVRITEKIYWA